MINIGDAILKIGLDKSELDKDMAAFQQKMQTSLKAVGAAFTAVGVAGSKMGADARKWNASLATTGVTLGKTTAEMRDMASELTNVTFGVESVIATMDVLARAGIRDAETIKASASAFDALADATGYTAEAMASMLIPAFKNMGVAIPETSEELDSFTWLVKNTMVNMEDFAAAMDYAAVYGESLNLTIDEMVGIMAALEAKGITGSAVTRKFRTAVTQAADGSVTLADALGLTRDEIDAFKDTLGEATGMTDKYAEAANTQYGLIDRLKQAWQEFTLRMGGLLSTLEPVFNVMTAMGPLMIIVSMKVGILKAAMIGLHVVLNAVKVAFTTMWGPIGLAIAAVGGVIGWLATRSRGVKVDVDRMNTSLETAKTRLEDMEKAGLGSSDAAKELTIQIEALEDAVDKYNKKLENNEVSMDNLTPAIEKYDDALRKVTILGPHLSKATDEILSGLEEGSKEYMISKMALEGLGDQLGMTAVEAQELTNSLADLIEDEEDLTVMWEKAVEAGSSLVQGMIIMEQQTRDNTDATKAYDEAVKDINETYGRSAASTAKTLIDIAKDESAALKDSLNERKRAIEDAARDAIDSARKVHDERLRLLDSETNETVRQLQDQIDAIDDADRAASKAIKDKQRKEKEAELRAAVANAWNRADRKKAEEALADFLEEVAQELAEEERQAQRESLQEQIKDVQEAANEKRSEIEEELRQFEEAKNAETDAQTKAIDQQLDGLEAALEEKLAMIEQERLAAIAAQEAIRDAVEKRTAAEIAALLDVQAARAKAGVSAESMFYGSPADIPNWSGKLPSNVAKWATGGMIREPSVISSMRTGRAYAVAGERGPEAVGPAGGITINVGELHVREDADVHRIAAEMMRLRQLKGSYGAS